MAAFINNLMKIFLSQLIIKNVYVVKNEKYQLHSTNRILSVIPIFYVNIYMDINMLTCLNTPTSILVQK